MKLVLNRKVDPSNSIGTVMNLEGNTLFIYDYIAKPYNWDDKDKDPNSIGSEEFLASIRNVGNTNDLDVRINSKGGELGYSLAVYQTLRECKNKVTTIVDGYAYSCAAWVMLAGDERQIMPGGIVMVHNPILEAVINSEESIAKFMPQWKASRDSIATIIADRTSMKIDDVYNIMDAQTFMNADEAIAKGFCTSKRDGKASIPSGVRNYLPSAISDAIPEVSNVDYSNLLSQTLLLQSKKATNR
jgi:ATP-dependent protease ClpP protease subunit